MPGPADLWPCDSLHLPDSGLSPGLLCLTRDGAEGRGRAGTQRVTGRWTEDRGTGTQRGTEGQAGTQSGLEGQAQSSSLGAGCPLGEPSRAGVVSGSGQGH